MLDDPLRRCEHLGCLYIFILSDECATNSDYSKKKEGEVVVCMFSFLRDIILFFYSFTYCVNHSRI